MALTFIASLAVCCFSFLSHPNGVACLLCWTLLIPYYQNLMGKYRALVLVSAISMLAITYLVLFDGRSPVQFYQDLMMVKDEYHNFDLIQSVWTEMMYIKSQHGGVELLLVAAIVVTLNFIFRWKTANRRPMEMMVLVCFLFITFQAAKWVPYNILLIPPLVCVLGEGFYRFANNTAIMRCSPRLMHIVLCLAALAITGDLCVKAYRYSATNSMFQYAFHVGNFDYAKYTQLKAELGGKSLSMFSDLRIIPLLSFMDLSTFYRDWQGRRSDDVNVPWNEDEAFVICSAEDGLTCRYMQENIHYRDHAVTYFDTVKLLGENFCIYAISSRAVGGGQNYRPQSFPPAPAALSWWRRAISAIFNIEPKLLSFGKCRYSN